MIGHRSMARLFPEVPPVMIVIQEFRDPHRPALVENNVHPFDLFEFSEFVHNPVKFFLLFWDVLRAFVFPEFAHWRIFWRFLASSAEFQRFDFSSIHKPSKLVSDWSFFISKS